MGFGGAELTELWTKKIRVSVKLVAFLCCVEDILFVPLLQLLRCEFAIFATLAQLRHPPPEIDRNTL